MSAIPNTSYQFPDESDNDSDEPSSDSEDEGADKDHYIYAEYIRVNRTRVRFKCDFRNAFILINGKEYVAKNLQGDF